MQDIIHRHMDGAGTLTIETYQDCTAIAEACKTQKLQGITGTSELKFAGRIPDVFILKYMHLNSLSFREVLGNKEHIKRIMNDPAMADFRVWQGKL